MPGYVPFRCPRCGCNLARLQNRIAESQQEYPNAFTPWTKADDDTLKTMYLSRASVDEIAESLGRQDTAILKRIDKRQLSLGKPGREPSTPNAGKPCGGPKNSAWIGERVASGMERDDELLQPHTFVQQGKLADGRIPTKCGVCSYDPSPVQPKTRRKK